VDRQARSHLTRRLRAVDRCPQLATQFREQSGVSAVGDVLVFLRIRLVIVQFMVESLRCFPVQPFHIAIPVSAHRVAHELAVFLASLELADGRLFHFRLRVCQHWRQALALQLFRHGKVCQLAKGGVDVEELHQSARQLSVPLGTGGANDQGHTGINLVVGLFAPAVVFAKLPTVIAP